MLGHRTYLPSLSLNTTKLALDKLAIKPDIVASLNVKSIAQFPRKGAHRSQGLNNPDPRASLLRQELDTGVVLELGLIGGLADTVGDHGGVVSLLGDTGGQLRGVGAQLLELANACYGALDLGGKGLGGVLEDTVDAGPDGDPLTLVDGCVGLVGYVEC